MYLFIYLFISTFTFMFIYIYIYMWVYNWGFDSSLRRGRMTSAKTTSCTVLARTGDVRLKINSFQRQL